MFNRLVLSLLRLFFSLLYHQFAWTYDWVAAAVSLGRWKDWLLTTLHYVNGGRVLELGHGPGHLQKALRNRKVISVGIDESPQMGKLASSRLKELGFTPLLVRGYAQSLPFTDSSYHQVVATFPTEYITATATLYEIHRVLMPGGRLVVLPAAWITGRVWTDRLAAWLFRITGQSPDRDDFQEKSIFDPLIDAGFHQVGAQWQVVRSSQVLIILAEKP